MGNKLNISGERLTFGPFYADVGKKQLCRDGVDVELRPQAFHLLRTLVHYNGQYVEYDRLIREAWDGVSVSKHTVTVTIAEVKRALQEYGSWISCRPKIGYRLEVPRSEDLIKRGWHFWSRRTREGFEKALGCFERAAQQDEEDFRAFEGLSSCYLMLGTFGMRPPREMHAGFVAAHRRAVALGGLTPESRADRAGALYIFERKFQEAEEELLQARREQPRLATIFVRLTMLYIGMRRFDDALDLIAQARATDSLWPGLPSAEIFVYFCLGQFETAAACGKQALELYPYMPLERALYAQALEHAGRVEEALAEYRLLRSTSPDAPGLRALEAICLAKQGSREVGLELREELRSTRQTDYVDATVMALLEDALGNRDQAFLELERAAEENSSWLLFLDVDPKFASLRSDSRYAHFRTQF
jgi:DNA-binding winged helix-turn-helix (wHTH) protein/Flp pilus assembly protein TadD